MGLMKILESIAREHLIMTHNTTETSSGAAEEKSFSGVGEAVKEGTADAAQDASNVLPAIGRFLSKTVYGGCYYAAYGVTFGALTVAKLIPTDNAFVHGLQEGSKAAAADVHKHDDGQPVKSATEAAEETAATSVQGLATA
jgi:hypothetical protein